MTIYLHYQLLGGSSVGLTHNDVVQGPIVVIAVMTEETSPPHFGRVWCSCECVTLTWVSLLSNQYRWGSISPPEASSWFIRIFVQWPFLKYGQHSPETCQVRYLQKEIIQRKPNWGSVSTISQNIDEWSPNTWWNFTICRLGSTRAIMVWLQSVHLNGHRWA